MTVSKTSGKPGSSDPTADSEPTDPDSPDNVTHPVEGNPGASAGPLCGVHFPGGWPAGAENSVGCEHGMWIRALPDRTQGV